VREGGGYAAFYHAAPVALMTLRVRDMVMVEANQAYLDMVGMTADQVVGRHLFDVFPESPTNPDGDQQAGLRGLCEAAIETKERAVAEELRYDIPSGDGFTVAWWNVVESPVLDACGEVEYLLHFAEDVTELHEARADLVRAQRSERQSAAQVTSLAEVALALTSATTVEDLEQVVVSRGLPVLGSDGGAIASRVGPEPADGWRVTISKALRAHLSMDLWNVSYDSPFPVIVSARTGERLLLGTREAGLAVSPEMQPVYDDTQRFAWACLPLVSRGRILGSLAVSWVDEREFTDAELALMEGFAAQCATALDRIVEAEKQRRAADRVRHLAEALQRSMLTPAPETDAVELAVRYRPANDLAQVGGDWYDALVQPDGDVTVVIGDVSGHDDEAAGKMGQVRGLLRALAYDSPAGSVASVLRRFEHVARGLHVDELATAVVARVDATPGPSGVRRVMWSNAGNPPPVVLEPDGTTRLLVAERADLLLGVEPDTVRHDHETELPAGSTLLLFTDGLVERRDASIDHGLDDLRRVLSELAGIPLEELCDAVLTRLDPHVGEDDIAMVAVRV
jgi:PAS domain S-box-containing protein